MKIVVPWRVDRLDDVEDLLDKDRRQPHREPSVRAFYPAFGLQLNPTIASAAMSLSSVTVISNALRLRRAAL